MIAKFTKKEDGRHRLTIVRDDETVSQGKIVPGFGADAIPHDLVHAVIEKTLGYTKGVYGTVNNGVELEQMLDPGQKQTNYENPELMQSEYLTAAFQGERAGIYSNEDYDPLLYCTQEQADQIRIKLDLWEAKWQKLPVGETLEFQI